MDMDKLLKFLYEDSQRDAALDEYTKTVMEETERLEKLEVSKAPLEKALGALDIETGDLELDPDRGYYYLETDDPTKFQHTVSRLQTPDGIHKLATNGWVASIAGDVRPTDGVGEFKIYFIDITTNVGGDAEEAESMEKIAKDSFDFVNGDMSYKAPEFKAPSTQTVGKEKQGEKTELAKKPAHESRTRRHLDLIAVPVY